MKNVLLRLASTALVAGALGLSVVGLVAVQTYTIQGDRCARLVRLVESGGPLPAGENLSYCADRQQPVYLAFVVQLVFGVCLVGVAIAIWRRASWQRASSLGQSP